MTAVIPAAVAGRNEAGMHIREQFCSQKEKQRG